MIKTPVQATSLLHSDRVAADDLEGQPARLLEPALEEFAGEGGSRAILLPLFFGPSGAMQDYLPPRLADLSQRFPGCEIRLAECLESPGDDSAAVLAHAIADQVAVTAASEGLQTPAVISTDHGSPKPEVAAVRDRVAVSLAGLDTMTGRTVIAASMERREGPEYAFNEPLLAQALERLAESDHREVVVALQFLFPGRHAGPGGDIVEICKEAGQRFPGLKIGITDPIGESLGVLDLLARRFRAAIPA